MFGGAVTSAGCGKRSFVRLGWDMDADKVGILTVLAGDSRSQACAGAKHGDIGGEYVADKFGDARPSSLGSQVLDEQRTDTLPLPSVRNQKCDLSLGGAQDLIRGNADGEPVVLSDQGHMIVGGPEDSLDLMIDGDASREEPQIATPW